MLTFINNGELLVEQDFKNMFKLVLHFKSQFYSSNCFYKYKGIKNIITVFFIQREKYIMRDKNNEGENYDRTG